MSSSGALTKLSTMRSGARSAPSVSCWMRMSGCRSKSLRPARLAVLIDEVLMLRQSLHRLAHRVAQPSQQPLQVLVLHLLRRMVIVRRDDTLTEQHLHPRIHTEQLVLALIRESTLAKQADTARQRIRNLHVPAVAPERCVVPRGRVVVEDDEVADSFQLVA